MQLSYQFWKPASGEHTKVVFLHGMGGTGSLWRPVAAALEDDYEILAPDQRGHGKSTTTESDYTPLSYGRDVVETLQTLNFHPTWLVGHSMGVRTACAAAHLRPDWVRGLVLIDLGLEGAAGGGLGDSLATFLRILPQEFPDRTQARAFMDQNCPDPSIAQYLLAVSVRTPQGTLSFPFDQNALIQTIQAANDVTLRPWVEELASRGMPILILRGADSRVWSHAEFQAEQKRFTRYPSVKFEEVANAGHGLPFEQRAFFLKRLRQFFEQPQT